MVRSSRREEEDPKPEPLYRLSHSCQSLTHQPKPRPLRPRNHDTITLVMSASVSFKGQKAMQKKIDRIAKRFPDRIKAALRIEAELVMTDSKQNYVPVDLGTLRGSGYVNDPERSGKDVEVSMGYGGAAEAYALSVHETPSQHDPPSWRGTTVRFSPAGRGPKYLEKPLKAAIPNMAERLAKRLEQKDE